jgi:hypothetical protein
MRDNRVCPIMNEICLKHNCSWYHKDKCAISHIARCLNIMNDKHGTIRHN